MGAMLIATGCGRRQVAVKAVRSPSPKLVWDISKGGKKPSAKALALAAARATCALAVRLFQNAGPEQLRTTSASINTCVSQAAVFQCFIAVELVSSRYSIASCQVTTRLTARDRLKSHSPTHVGGADGVAPGQVRRAQQWREARSQPHSQRPQLLLPCGHQGAEVIG